MPSTKSQGEKDKGNSAFKAGDFPTAIGHYSAAILLDPINPTYPLNRAAAYLKLGKSEDAERDCDRVLALDTKNVKAVFRRGQARVGLQKLAQARDEHAASSPPAAASAPENIPPPRTQTPPADAQTARTATSSQVLASQSNTHGARRRTPLTLFDFSREWEKCSTSEDRWALLKEVSPPTLPSLFQSSLEAQVLAGIVGTLRDVLRAGDLAPQERERVHDYMRGLTQVKRFSTVVLFMSNEERGWVNDVWGLLGGGEGARAWGVS
ncbi:hypothetical protein FOMPIDRAFT_1031313 [Fomitopsis schrenkii]|uniref:RNA polymerase II-associated protein 3 n=1 Tax=Fomitopsis schrenkii TaxID=2126942 RepID=S8E5C9_FOMSC|nr:hypothetical protein FOMPIDRAFT_1031313 [Fomitopsis schrenkii]